MNDRIMSSEEFKEDKDMTIRPVSLDEYVGQSEIKENLGVFIKSSVMRGETLDHILLYGPPGLGKTTLAYIIANELGTNIKTASGPSIEKSGDLAAILSTLEEGDVLFIDEIHRIPRYIEEILYPAMEDFYLDIIVGSDGSSRNIKINLPHFTLVGATTRAGDLSSPLRDRFGIRLFKRVRDFALVYGDGIINKEILDNSLDRLKVDKTGLDDTDYNLLLSIVERFNGGPVGLEALASSIGEEASTIEDVYEPYLLQQGYLKRTARGRVVTDKTYEYLGIKKD